MSLVYLIKEPKSLLTFCHSSNNHCDTKQRGAVKYKNIMLVLIQQTQALSINLLILEVNSISASCCFVLEVFTYFRTVESKEIKLALVAFHGSGKGPIFREGSFELQYYFNASIIQYPQCLSYFIQEQGRKRVDIQVTANYYWNTDMENLSTNAIKKAGSLLRQCSSHKRWAIISISYQCNKFCFSTFCLFCDLVYSLIDFFISPIRKLGLTKIKQSFKKHKTIGSSKYNPIQLP